MGEKCAYLEKVILLILEEDLRDMEDVLNHIKICPVCSREKKVLSSLISKLREHSEPQPLTLSEFTHITSLIKTHPKKSKRSVQNFSIFKPILAFAIVILLLLGTLLLMNRGPKPSLVNLTPEDKEVIEKLDLLRELNTLEKLVNIAHQVPEKRSQRTILRRFTVFRSNFEYKGRNNFHV